MGDTKKIMPNDYNEGEIYKCSKCGLRIEISKTASPVQDLTCCGVDMEPREDDSRQPGESDPSDEYQVGDEYFCPVCGLETRILASGSPSIPFSCCGVPMELK